MDSFLHKVSRYLLERYSTGTAGLCVVLPNRRAGLFLKRHLAQQLDRPAWAPSVFSIEDFVYDLSGYEKPDQAELLFTLYAVYREHEKEKAESFELFCKWAPVLLSDFNDADSYLADPVQLFGNLRDIKSIENWSLGAPTLTGFQKQYLHFWNSIGTWHNAFCKKLSATKKAYPGMAYRLVADDPGGCILKKNYGKIIFAGLHALNKAEEKIIAVLRENGKADVLWDADRYYLEDPVNEAGRFLRRYREKYFRPLPGDPSHFEHIEDRLASEVKNITVAGAARMVSQAKTASHFLSTLDAGNRNSPSTAIVLCDEQLLLPVLHALPEETENVNITMGFPLRNTPASSLITALLLLRENAERFHIRTRDGEIKFYHADITRLLRHPYFRRLLPDIAEKLEEHLARYNVTFSSCSQLIHAAKAGEENAALLKSFFRYDETPATIMNGISEIVLLLRDSFGKGKKEDPSSSFNIDTEYLFSLHRVIRRTKTLCEEWPFATDFRSLKTLVQQQVISAALPFYGEPVAGLQVMGLLETRALDFENVILLSANENILPASKQQPSFILHDLRKAFGLPLWNDRDSVAAYHFYRLLQRAKNIFLVYNTEQDSLGSRERSRFITQLLHELPKKNRKAVIRETVFDAGLPGKEMQTEPIVIAKTPAVFQKLSEFAEKGLSPSALNSYRSCPLQFYFHYVAGIRETEEVEETIEANTLGTIIHRALEELFRPLEKKEIRPETLAAMKKKAAGTCETMFAKYFTADEAASGKNLLALHVATRYITQYLESEKKRLEETSSFPKLVALETDLETFLPVNGHQVKLIGKADRIDEEEGCIILTDYKTGKAEKKELAISEWEELRSNPSIGKSFQLLMYAWLYEKMNTQKRPLLSGILSLRKPKDGLMKVVTPDGEMLSAGILEKFENELRLMLQEIFSENESFVQTDDVSICQLCLFNSICRKV